MRDTDISSRKQLCNIQ